MSYLQTKVLSHSYRVRALYKESLRQLQSFYYFRHLYRYHAVLLRARFDEAKDEKDMIKAKQMLQDGEEELFLNQHPQPFKFPNSPGGISFGREPVLPDWIVDMWHPLERAQYPDYFARREKRKLEFIERWEKKYGKPDPNEHH
jgi:NADH dehydrogenase (ubiquinone) 1 beta subcomplex subunit 9